MPGEHSSPKQLSRVHGGSQTLEYDWRDRKLRLGYILWEKNLFSFFFLSFETDFSVKPWLFSNSFRLTDLFLPLPPKFFSQLHPSLPPLLLVPSHFSSAPDHSSSISLLKRAVLTVISTKLSTTRYNKIQHIPLYLSCTREISKRKMVDNLWEAQKKQTKNQGLPWRIGNKFFRYHGRLN